MERFKARKRSFGDLDKERAMARTSIHSAGWTWSAVASGVIASLVVQVLLTMLGLGIGLVSFDTSSSASVPAWAGFAWWAASGIFAAAVGGTLAGTLSPTENMRLKAIGGLTAWAIATLIVIGVGGFTASAGVTAVSALGGPVVTASRNLHVTQNTSTVRRETVGQTMPVSADEARKQFATGMLVSAIALVLGAIAAFFGGWFAPSRTNLEA
jgi:hypothetical protein